MPRHADLRPRKLRSGLWRVDVAPSLSPNGKRQKKDFPTEARAKTHILQLKAHHAQPVALTDEQIREAHAVYSRLPDGLKLAEAVERGTAIWLRERTGRTFSTVLEQVIAAKQGSGVTQKHLSDIRQKGGRFAAHVGQRSIAGIEPAEIRSWLMDLREIVKGYDGTPDTLGKPLSAESRNCYRRILGLVFGFALREGFIGTNPVAAVGTNKVPPKSIGIFTPEEARSLLAAATAHKFDADSTPTKLSYILPVVALGLFAGLRPEETYWLEWSQVDWEHRQIDITKGKTAAAGPRYVPMHSTLLAWLEPYRDWEGRVAPTAMFRTLAKVRRKANISHWPKDVLRHSYASYTLPLHPDVHALAAKMGNSVAVIHKHYRRPVRVEAANAFWNILPP